MKMRIVFDKEKAERMILPAVMGCMAVGGFMLGFGVCGIMDDITYGETIADGKMFQKWFHDHPVGVTYDVYAIMPEDVSSLRYPMYYQIAREDRDVLKISKTKP